MDHLKQAMLVNCYKRYANLEWVKTAMIQGNFMKAAFLKSCQPVKSLYTVPQMSSLQEYDHARKNTITHVLTDAEKYLNVG